MSSVCPSCGNGVAAGSQFCSVCGGQVSAVAGVGVPATPIGPAQTSPKAIISLVCGLLFFVPFSFIAAIVFGHIGLSEIKRSAGRLKGEGLAIAGLVLGYLWIVSIPIFLIIAAIAIPNLLRARMAANEASAVASVRTLNVAEATYAAQHPDEGYTCSLSALQQSGQITGGLALGQQTGYRFELSGCTPGPDGKVIAAYKVVASPIVPNQTGVRAFCSDDSAVIKVEARGSAHTCMESGQTLQ